MRRTFPLTVALVAATLAAAVFLSCATQGGTGGRQVSLLPLSNGWYQYDSERTFKGIEDEYNMSQSLGVKVTQEITYKYTGVVTNFAGGTLYDPVTKIELFVDRAGTISCAENVSIRGAVNRDGSFHWNGLHEENGKLNSLSVRGTLTPLPASVRAGRECDGVYHMTDPGTGSEQLVKISGGFYTWNYVENKKITTFNPWPTLVRPDGTFSFSLDITTNMEMGAISRTNFTNGLSSQGRVIPGQGISLEEVVRSAGLGNDQKGKPQVYSGTTIRSGEFPNEAIPADFDNIIGGGRTAARAVPRPDRAHYPSWYLNLPVKAGFTYAAGEKTFANREIAFTMAEAAAAANLADQIVVRIQSVVTEVSNNAGTTVEENIRSETLQWLNYRVVERTYNEKTGTAFVLLETES